MISDRIAELEKKSKERGTCGRESHFFADYHGSALTRFAECELWEKTARAMAYAIENQDVWVEEDDRIGALEGSRHHTLGVVRSNGEADLQARDMGAQAGPVLRMLGAVLGTDGNTDDNRHLQGTGAHGMPLGKLV